MRARLILWGALLLASPVRADAARDLMHEIRCPVCAGQSIADSEADMAADLREFVEKQLAAGQSPAAVKALLVERYGPSILFTPPLTLPTALLWATPLLLLGVGLWLARGLFAGKKTDA